jgi:[acyl-carrier-protein] S-malonyltransferase
MKTALLCSGQGSQYVGMLKDIAEKFPSANDQIKKADDILGFSISNICFDGPMDILKETRYTQPALFLHSAVIFDLIKNEIKFDCVAGHSVGEYAALYAAGVLGFEDALKLVALRGDLMFHAGEDVQGTMYAIINLDDDKVREVCDKLTDPEKELYVVPANFNSPGQIVVSGSAQYLRDNIGEFKTAGAKLVKELVVSGAFHSPLMKPAKEILEKTINTMDFKDTTIPVYSNVHAKPLISGNEIKQALIDQLMSPVLWTQSLLEMQKDSIAKFIEIGAGSVLQGLVKRTLSDVEILGVDKAEDIEKFKSN